MLRMLVARPCTKKGSNYILTSLLVGLCRSMWIIDLLVTLFNPHLGTLARPSTPKVLRVRERTPIPFPFVVLPFGFVVEYVKEFGRASQCEEFSLLVLIGPPHKVTFHKGFPFCGNLNHWSYPCWGLLPRASKALEKGCGLTLRRVPLLLPRRSLPFDHLCNALFKISFH